MLAYLLALVAMSGLSAGVVVGLLRLPDRADLKFIPSAPADLPVPNMTLDWLGLVD